MSARYLNLFTSILNTRVAKAWTKFDEFLDIIHAFALESSSQVENSINQAIEP